MTHSGARSLVCLDPVSRLPPFPVFLTSKLKRYRDAGYLIVRHEQRAHGAVWRRLSRRAVVLSLRREVRLPAVPEMNQGSRPDVGLLQFFLRDTLLHGF